MYFSIYLAIFWSYLQYWFVYTMQTLMALGPMHLSKNPENPRTMHQDRQNSTIHGFTELCPSGPCGVLAKEENEMNDPKPAVK